MRRLALLAVAALAPACTRDLSVPNPNPVKIQPEFATAAPRQHVSLTVTGGSGTYTFAFGDGGQLSGTDATVAQSGDYQAGSLGSAQDVVVVRDGAGSTAEARITVGPRLALSPPVASVAPGGTATFVASGGHPPYAFALHGSTDARIDAAGNYTAGNGGNAVDQVVLSDSTGDPAAMATAEVQVGNTIQVYPSTASAPPGDTLLLVALGGQAPYTFSLVQHDSDGTARTAQVNPVTGRYRAGSNDQTPGDKTDVVQVDDGNGQVATAMITIGAPLQLSSSLTAVTPGVTVRLEASGGKPPYLFGFQDKGNRSQGSIERATGAYTPGGNYGAQDLIQVTDSTGSVALLGAPPTVGPLEFRPGTAPYRCVAADLNGDGRGDVAVLRYSTTTFYDLLDLTTYLLPEGRAPAEEVHFLPPDHDQDQIVSADLDGDGHDELRLFGPSGMLSLLPDTSGNLTASGPTLFQAPPLNLQAQPPLTVTTTSSGHRFFTKVGCQAAGPRNGIMAIDWDKGDTAPTSSVCVALPRIGTVTRLAAGDLNGDGRTDLAWLESDTGPLQVALGTPTGFAAAPDFTAPFPVESAPLEWWVAGPMEGDHEATFRVVPGGVALTGRIAPYTNRWSVLFWRASGSSMAVYEPFPGPNTWGLTGFQVISGATFAAWNWHTGQLAGFAPDATGQLAPVDLLPDASLDPVGCAAFPDLNGDHVPDLVAASATTGRAAVYWGDGDGGFGRRRHFEGVSPWAVADVDGDGLDDVVGVTSLPGLAVLWGGSHQLAMGREARLSLPIADITAGDFDIPQVGRISALTIDQAGKVELHPIAANGAVGDPVAMSTGWFSFTSSMPNGISPARFGGDAGLGFWGVYGTGSWPYFQALIRSDPTTFAWQETYPPPVGVKSCAMLPVGRAAAPTEPVRVVDVAALCVLTGGKDLGIQRAQLASRSAFHFAQCEFDNPTCAWAALAAQTKTGTDGTNAAAVAAGNLPDGTAVFVASAGSTGSAPVWVVAVQASDSAGGPLSITWTSVPELTRPVIEARVGSLNADSPTPFPDLAVRMGSRIYALLGSAPGAAGPFTVRDAAGASGALSGMARLSTGALEDPLLMIGSDLVPLVNDGSGSLQ
jgi:hypothetical protein